MTCCESVTQKDGLPGLPEGRPARVAGRIVVLLVGFGNADDVANCVKALAAAEPEPSFEVFIAENGGPGAMDALFSRFVGGNDHACREVAEPLPSPNSHLMRRVRRLHCHSSDGQRRIWLNIAEMTENLGYAGAINAWLRQLLQVTGWDGAWILNPDAEPTPSALAELVAYSSIHRKAMIGSRLLPKPDSEYIHSRGLAWRKLTARTEAVDFHASVDSIPDPETVDARLDAPSGASLYVTRQLIEAIGLMDERYFLYFEDLDWGVRAKEFGGIGYAHASVVPHKGGTTTRSAGNRRRLAPFAVYLEFRNCILFVRERHPGWLPWTVMMQVLYTLHFMGRGSMGSMVAAGRGILAGLRGEVGRPDRWIAGVQPYQGHRQQHP